MGLDMNLTADRFIGYSEDALRENIAGCFPDIHDLKVSVVTADVMYWRKANAIHNWFVKNAQNGVDECQRTHLSIGTIQSLLDTIRKVLANRELALELLPPTMGFFFGSNELDDHYWHELEYTATTLEEDVLSDKYKGWEFYYQSSW